VFGGAGETAGFGDSAEVAELMKFHGGNSKFLSMIPGCVWPASGSLYRPVLPFTAARVAAAEFQANERNRV